MAGEKRNSKQMHKDFGQKVGQEAARKRRARLEKDRSLWFGLGTMGMVGWSVAIPTLLGVLIGLWLDANWPGSFSWTLTLLVTGLVIGCLGAWQWVRQEMDKMERKETEEQRDE